MKPSVQRVADALAAAGVTAEIQEFGESTRTAEEAARAVGATVGQIVKSLVFLADGKPILALVSGANRADSAKLGAAAGGQITRADADTVRAATGYSIGGVPPLGHATELRSFCDRDLLQYTVLWAAAGAPNAVFRTTPQELVRISGATVVDLAASSPGA
jgi:prolyl-tRNA editing enzyme YbaK/EbsC (Cys-tRNA(Pro) deacylase)